MSLIGLDIGTAQSAGYLKIGLPPQREVYVKVQEDFKDRVGVSIKHEKSHPSYVQYDTRGQLITAGTRAKLLANGFPQSTVYDAKRIIGRRFDDPVVQTIRKATEERGQYTICDVEQQAWIRVGQSKIAPEDIEAENIAGILEDAFRMETNLQIDEIVISVPAYFNNVQKLKTREAAMLAVKKIKQTEYGDRIHVNVDGKRPEDLKEITLISESSAAFITYVARGGIKNVPKDGNVLVFDLGAGSLDITIGTAEVIQDPVTLKDNVTLDIKMIHGNTALGGRDMDRKICEYIVEELSVKKVAMNNRLMWQIIEKVEKARIELSIAETTEIDFRNRSAIIPDSHNCSAVIPLTRVKMEQIIAPLLDKCREEIRTALLKANLKKGDVSAVVMVGGLTNMPSIKSLVEDEVGVKIETVENWDPLSCVAEGATRSASVTINEIVPYDYYAAVEMFSGVYVTTRIASAGEPANLDKTLEILVPMYDRSYRGVDRLLIFEAECKNGVTKSECIQCIDLYLYEHSTLSQKTFSPEWTNKELEHLNPITLNYAKICMQCRITKEGMIVWPEYNYSPGNWYRISYPDLSIGNLSHIDVIDMPTFDRDFPRYAQDKFIRPKDDEISDAFKVLMNEYHCTREQAWRSIIRMMADRTAEKNKAYDVRMINEDVVWKDP